MVSSKKDVPSLPQVFRPDYKVRAAMMGLAGPPRGLHQPQRRGGVPPAGPNAGAAGYAAAAQQRVAAGHSHSSQQQLLLPPASFAVQSTTSLPPEVLAQQHASTKKMLLGILKEGQGGPEQLPLGQLAEGGASLGRQSWEALEYPSKKKPERKWEVISRRSPLKAHEFMGNGIPSEMTSSKGFSGLPDMWQKPLVNTSPDCYNRKAQNLSHVCPGAEYMVNRAFVLNRTCSSYNKEVNATDMLATVWANKLSGGLTKPCGRMQFIDAPVAFRLSEDVRHSLGLDRNPGMRRSCSYWR